MSPCNFLFTFEFLQSCIQALEVVFVKIKRKEKERQKGAKKRREKKSRTKKKRREKNKKIKEKKKKKEREKISLLSFRLLSYIRVVLELFLVLSGGTVCV